MNNTILQVPISKSLRTQALEAISNMGFSSLQEYIRVFLSQTVNKSITISFGPKTIKLSSQAAKRYDKIAEDIKTGKIKTKSFTNVDDLMAHLNS